MNKLGAQSKKLSMLIRLINDLQSNLDEDDNKMDIC